MIFYNVSSIKSSPALLDKYIYIYILFADLQNLAVSEAHTYENDFCCLKSISQVIKKYGLKKVLCVNQLVK